MVRKINRLLAEQAESAEELRISEFNSLQSQINPHFLYNTMDMINWKAQQGGNIFLIAHYVTEPYPEHSHDYYELNYLYRGTLINTIDGRDVYMSAGDLIMINLRTSHSLTPKTDNCLLLNICLRKEFFRKILRHTIRKHSAMNGLILRRSENRLKYIFYPLIQNRRFQVLLSSVLQTYSAGRFRETPELERLFIRMFDELSATDEYSLTGPDEETLRLISASMPKACARLRTLLQKPD